ncbi:Peptidyl-prolyl cis-trans isomerase B [Serratia symbiotica]|nr:Peptidyl-prolyl cis-trans isomerase B [Serratia symbiotica]
MATLNTNYSDLLMSTYSDKALVIDEYLLYFSIVRFDEDTKIDDFISAVLIHRCRLEPDMNQKPIQVFMKSEAHNGLGQVISTFFMIRSNHDLQSTPLQFCSNVREYGSLNICGTSTEDSGYYGFVRLVQVVWICLII